MIIAVLFFILLTVIAVSYICYRIVFLAPKRIDDSLYRLPQGEQYEPHNPGIQKSIDEMLERPFEAVTITSHDGLKLYARYYHVADNAPLQILFHGYKSSAILDFCGGSKLAGRMGQNALVVDQRSHGQSEGTSITFGVEERRDCLSWIHYAISRFGENTRIILSGLSMGAATVLMVNDLDMPDNVIGIIADCPYSSPKAIIQKVGHDMGYPSAILYPFIRLGARLFAHFNTKESSSISAAAQSKIPILLIHGEDDRFVPCDMSREIYRSNPARITLVTIPDAGHGLCYMTDPKRYEEAIIQFMNRIL